MKKIIAFLTCLFLCGNSFAAISFGSTVDGGDNGGSTNSLSYSFNNVAGDILFVGIVGDSPFGSAKDDITSVTYNSAPMTLVQKSVTGGVDRFSYVYMMVSPPTGSHTVAIACTDNHFLLSGAISYLGTKQTAQPDNSVVNFSGAAATTLTTSLISTATNCWFILFDCGYSSGAHATAGAGATIRSFDVANGTWEWFDSNSAQVAGSYSMTTDRPSAIDATGHIMISVAPVFVAPPTPTLPVPNALSCQ